MEYQHLQVRMNGAVAQSCRTDPGLRSRQAREH
jgi:hypothetical protein